MDLIGGTYNLVKHKRLPYLSSVYIGGAIIVNNSVVNISQSMFEDNRADLGGAILAEQRCTNHLSKY